MKTLLGCTLCIALAAGCSGGPSSQLTACQEDKDQLLKTIREQRETIRTVRADNDSLAKRLDESEKILARGYGGGTRLSSRPDSPSTAVQAESLPWRAPSGKVEGVPARK
jgi:hypothetical protein